MRILRVLKETFLASLPLLVVIGVVTLFVAPLPNPQDYLRLLVGYIGVVVGQSLFLVGLHESILPIGENVGRSLVKVKRFAVVIFFGLLFGLLATVAEPALAVLARQTHLLINAVNEKALIWLVGVGVGVFVSIALWRIVRSVSIKFIFAALYALLFAMMLVVPQEFVALAFDGSGATTGDISVPFILTLGLGVSATMSKRRSSDDVFGIIGIASIGPILAIFVYGMVLKALHGGIPPVDIYSPGDAAGGLWQMVISNIGNVALAIIPMLLVFLLFQFWLLKLPKTKVKGILCGMIPVFIGLLIFLVGIDFGFAFAGQYIGEVFLAPTRPEWFQWLLLPVAFVLGASITLAEPAVTVLGEQLENITGRQIKRMTIRLTLAGGIGVAAVLAVVKILEQVNILAFLLPLYAVALLMMAITPRLFIGLAFDSGGVTGGALSSALLTPMTLGIAQAIAATSGEHAPSVLTNGFGVIAFISVTPLIAVQGLGIWYSVRHKSNLGELGK
ncbi:MAG: DUF1538 domain-containing protein [Oscillospiraceae bacterium]|nr:DUF1538 domain-containing protein [Oscillospiraceae bacterium]